VEQGGWLYIMANRYRGGMYVGVTADAIHRVHQHRAGEGSQHVRDFSKQRLVYVEHHATIEGAIAREKLVKKRRREWKFALIEADNPDWADLWEQWFAPETPQK
jgi:putative endonuclease